LRAELEGAPDLRATRRRFDSSIASPSLEVNVSDVCSLGPVVRAVTAALVMLQSASVVAMAGPSARTGALDPDRLVVQSTSGMTKLASARTARRAPGESEPVYPWPYADIVVDANSGNVLHADRADEPRHPASLAKVMTLYLLFEQLEAGRVRLDSEFLVSEHASVQEPTKLDLEAGETLQVEDAILGLVTKSANDAAVVVAEALAGSERAFAEKMTATARALGMFHTVYRNASGLPDDEQVTTARDQATLGRSIQERFPRYYRYFSTQSFKWRGEEMPNHNKLLGRVEGMDGIKTGYIRSSRYNLLASVRRDDRHIVAVVLGGATRGARDTRMRTLIKRYIDQCLPRGKMEGALPGEGQEKGGRPVSAVGGRTTGAARDAALIPHGSSE
jgi:D-alanyl-D-alanine carboxypeptidase